MKRPHKLSFAPPPVQPSNVLFLFVSRSQISIHPTYSQRCDIFKERSSRCPIDRREQSLRWQNPEIAKEEQESGIFPGFPTAGPLSARPGSDKHFRKIAHKFGAFVHETVAAAGFMISPCLWNICILWNVECIMNWTVAHVYNSFKASLKCTHVCANFGLNAHSLCISKTLLNCVCVCVCV